jgi:hypothetical protein
VDWTHFAFELPSQEGQIKGREENEEGVSSYRVKSRKREDPGSSKRKNKFAVSGELASEEATDLT